MLRIIKYGLALVVLWLIPTFLFSMQWAFDYIAEGRFPWSWMVFQQLLPRWMIWAPLTPAAIWIARRIESAASQHRIKSFALHLAAVFVLVIPATLVWAFAPVNGPSKITYGMHFAMLYPVSLVWTFAVYGAIAALTYAFDARLATERLEKQLVEARLEALHAQLRPHFFFNTLHSIASLIRANRNSEAISMIARLGELMRETLNDGGVRTTLARELDLVRLYLEIQKVRFPDRLRVDFQTDACTFPMTVPSLLLQPLVENAIDHGIALLPEGGEIRIASHHSNQHLVLEVRNTGTLRPAFTEGVGIRNTKQRLLQTYGAAQSFRIEDVGGSVSVRIEIPW